ncbi:unnamed protein product, partial [Rotaria magnacalcarata]
MKKIQSTENLDLEHIIVEIENKNFIIIVCYRSTQQKKLEFLENLKHHLECIDCDDCILIVGDLNEDSLESKSKTISKALEHLGFANIFKHLPTTS